MSRVQKNKLQRRKRNKLKIRKKIFGTNEQPRISVFRSSKHTYVQVISDESGQTIAAASTKHKDFSCPESSKSIAAAKVVGEMIAKELGSAGLTKAVFDRNGYRYHGRVKSVAEGIRETGFSI